MDFDKHDNGLGETPPPLPPDETDWERTRRPTAPPPPPRFAPPPPHVATPQRAAGESDNLPGLLGFIFSVATFFGFFAMPLGIGMWVVGLVLSCIGMGKRPRGLAIAGLCVSLFSLLLLIFLIALFGIAVTAMSNNP